LREFWRRDDIGVTRKNREFIPQNGPCGKMSHSAINCWEIRRVEAEFSTNWGFSLSGDIARIRKDSGSH
jgi:hypothetical protein